MLTLLLGILLGQSTNGPTGLCINDALLDVPKYGITKAFLNNCTSPSENDLIRQWHEYAPRVFYCNNGISKFFQDKSLSRIEALISTGANCTELDYTSTPVLRDSIFKNDSLRFANLHREEAIFLSNYAKVLAGAYSYINRNATSVVIDSLALRRVKYSQRGTTNELDTTYTYAAWIITKSGTAAKIYLIGRRHSIDSSILDEDAPYTDTKISFLQDSIYANSMQQADLFFSKNKKILTAAIRKCVEKYAHDPNSIQILDVRLESIKLTAGTPITVYNISMRGKNSFGALVLTDNKIAMNNYTCIGYVDQ